MSVAGLLLAAGEGRRYGGPKALARDDEGVAWVRSRAQTLLDGGCSPVVVVVGSARTRVTRELDGLEVMVAPAASWEEGMGASLRTGLVAARLDALTDAALVALVDTPGLTSDVVARLVERGARQALAQAAYGGSPGHPVLLGRDHWHGVIEVAVGDRGARDYLRSRDVELVECGDVGSGEDIDHPVV